MKILITSIVLILFSINIYSQREISLGVGGLSYGLSFHNDINDTSSFRVTGLALAYQAGDSFWDKTANLSIQYNYNLKKSKSESFYTTVAASVFYSIAYSGSLTDYKKENYYKTALGFGVNKVFFDTLSLTLEFHQILHFNNNESHVDHTHTYRAIVSYPSISLYLGTIF